MDDQRKQAEDDDMDDEIEHGGKDLTSLSKAKRKHIFKVGKAK